MGLGNIFISLYWPVSILRCHGGTCLLTATGRGSLTHRACRALIAIAGDWVQFLIYKKVSISAIEVDVDSDLTARAIAWHQICLLVPMLCIWDGNSWNKKFIYGCKLHECIFGTGRLFRLCKTSHCHQNKGCILINGHHIKTELLLWYQQKVLHNLNDHPVLV